MLISLSFFSSDSLDEIQSLIFYVTKINFEIVQSNKLDNLDQPWVLKFCKKINESSANCINTLIEKNIIKTKSYSAGLSGIPVLVVYECDFEKLNTYYKDELFLKNYKEEKEENSQLPSADFFQPDDFSGELYKSVSRNNFNKFCNTINLISNEKINEALNKVSKKINDIKPEKAKNNFNRKFCEFTNNFENILTIFADKLLQTNDYDKKNKKIFVFLKELENAVKEFKSNPENKIKNAKNLYQKAESISKNLKIAHNSQLFSCVAKAGNRSKMAKQIDRTLTEYSYLSIAKNI